MTNEIESKVRKTNSSGATRIFVLTLNHQFFILGKYKKCFLYLASLAFLFAIFTEELREYFRDYTNIKKI